MTKTNLIKKSKYFILGSVAATLIFSGCGNTEENKSSTQTQQTSQQVQAVTPKEDVVSQVEQAANDLVATSEEVIEEVSDEAIAALDEITNLAEDTNQELSETVDDVQENVSDTVEQSQEVIEEIQDQVSEATETIEETKEEITAQVEEAVSSVDAQKAYSKCIACHGKNGEKVALGKSKIIKDMTKEDFVASLKGYQDGTYGGAMKSIMVGNVKGMSEDEFKAMADLIVK